MRWYLYSLLGIASIAGTSAAAPTRAPLTREPETLIVCPAGAVAKDCAFKGNQAIQAAVDRAADGDIVLIRAGTYVVEKPRDVKFDDYVIRAYVVIDRKSLHLIGEPGAVIDGTDGPAATAMLVNGSNVTIRDLTFRHLRVASDEDDIYDGHGVFIMNSTAAVNGVVLDHFEKMGLSARGTSNVTATNLRIVDGHVGIWARESAQLHLCNSVVRNNNGVGVGGAAHASIHVYNSVLQANQLDGLYLKEDASAIASNSIIADNKPSGVSAKDNARAWVTDSVLSGNEKGATSIKDAGAIKIEPGVADIKAPVGPSEAAGCLRAQ